MVAPLTAREPRERVITKYPPKTSGNNQKNQGYVTGQHHHRNGSVDNAVPSISGRNSRSHNLTAGGGVP